MEQCWDDIFSETPNGLNDHGTHTMGIIGGLVNENDTIGSAYNCYWIANDETSTVEEPPGSGYVATSFEWSLNPDGDLNTDYDVPDVTTIFGDGTTQLTQFNVRVISWI